MEKGLSIIIERELLDKDFRVYGTFENPLFLARDVAKWIGHNQANRMIELVDEDEKLKCLVRTSGQKRKMWFLTENGLYEILMQSRKTIAKDFKREVKKILKDVRKNGIHVRSGVLDTIIENPDMAIEILSRLRDEKNKVKELNAIVKVQMRKVIFADAVAKATTTILVGDLAKLIKQNGVDVGQNRLFQWLRENGYLMKKKGSFYNMPTQKAMDMKLFKVQETIKNNGLGETIITKTPKVTGKGQVYFISKFLQ